MYEPESYNVSAQEYRQLVRVASNLTLAGIKPEDFEPGPLRRAIEHAQEWERWVEAQRTEAA